MWHANDSIHSEASIPFCLWTTQPLKNVKCVTIFYSFFQHKNAVPTRNRPWFYCHANGFPMAIYRQQDVISGSVAHKLDSLDAVHFTLSDFFWCDIFILNLPKLKKKSAVSKERNVWRWNDEQLKTELVAMSQRSYERQDEQHTRKKPIIYIWKSYWKLSSSAHTTHVLCANSISET